MPAGDVEMETRLASAEVGGGGRAREGQADDKVREPREKTRQRGGRAWRVACCPSMRCRQNRSRSLDQVQQGLDRVRAIVCLPHGVHCIHHCIAPRARPVRTVWKEQRRRGRVAACMVVDKHNTHARMHACVRTCTVLYVK